jgi:hypothetical protein
LTDNAVILSKQGSIYSEWCGLIMFFDYESMVVLDFHTGTENAEWDDLTSPVKFFWSDGSGITHKQLLLATLIYGMRKEGVMGPNGGFSFIA